jgi:hypothetical protein
MGQSTDEDLDKALRESGFKKEEHDDYYYRSNDRGGLEKVWTDKNWSQSNEDNMHHRKHQDGDRY